MMTDAGEMIRWMILAIQKVPCLSFEPHVSKILSAGNTIDSATSITTDSLVLSKFLPQENQAQFFYENIFSLIPNLKKFLPIMVCIFILNIFSMQDKKPEAQLQALMVKLIF